MRFSEHASLPTPKGRRLAAWRGIGLYKGDGERLGENYVEQDFRSRRAQLAGGEPHELEPPHLDPWMATQPLPADADAESVARSICEEDRLHEATWAQIDDGIGDAVAPLVVAPDEVTINDLFSAGRRVAVHATVRGGYRGGVDGVANDAKGSEASLQVAALLRVAPDGGLEEVRAVTSREVVRSALRPR